MENESDYVIVGNCQREEKEKKKKSKQKLIFKIYFHTDKIHYFTVQKKTAIKLSIVKYSMRVKESNKKLHLIYFKTQTCKNKHFKNTKRESSLNVK